MDCCAWYETFGSRTQILLISQRNAINNALNNGFYSCFWNTLYWSLRQKVSAQINVICRCFLKVRFLIRKSAALL